MPNYPTDNNVDFYVCESAREEARGKISLLGLIPNGKILVTRKQPSPIIFPIAFVYVAKDGAGKYKTSLGISSPSGKALPFPSGILSEVEKFQNKSMSIMLNFPLFPVEEMGTFIVTLKLDDHSYPRSFSVDYED